MISGLLRLLFPQSIQQFAGLAAVLVVGGGAVLAITDALALRQAASSLPTARAVVAELRTVQDHLAMPDQQAASREALDRGVVHLTTLQARIQRARQAVDHWQ